MSGIQVTILIALVGLILSGIIALNNFFGLRDRFLSWRKEKQLQKKESSKNLLTIKLDNNFESKDLNELELVLDEYYRFVCQGEKPVINFEIDEYSALVTAIETEKTNSKPDRQKLLRLNNAVDKYKISGLNPDVFLNDLVFIAISNFYKNPNRVSLSSKEITRVVFQSIKKFARVSNEQNGRKFDIFHTKIRGWYSWIFLSEEELTDLMEKKGANAPQQLTRNWGLDIFDLSNEIRINKVFPSMVFEYLDMKYRERSEEPDPKEFFNIFNWKIGIG